MTICKRRQIRSRPHRKGVFSAFVTSLACVQALIAPSLLYAADPQPPPVVTITTAFTTIRATSDRDLSEFCWRISGQRVEGRPDAQLRRAVDEIVARVQALLGMYPDAFRVRIVLQSQYTGGSIASYSHREHAITVAADRVTDGVLAHEIAHAVINAYFDVPPPEQVQEILAQYVDRHLWGE